MKSHRSLRRIALGCLLAVLTSSPDLFGQNTVDLFSTDPANVGALWFKTRTGPERAAGVVEFANAFFQTAAFPSLPALQGASISWTPDNLYLHLHGGGAATREVLTPFSTPIADVIGVSVLASGFRVTTDVSASVLA